MEKLIAGPMKGYKVTDRDMKCKNYQFKLGKIHELENDNPLVLCKNGFHFCEQPSGPWSYYSKGRLFEVEAYDILDSNFEPGTNYKRVCRKIKLVKEIHIKGDYNTGDYNTGDYNTGDYNTGYYNTGNKNTGHYNTGHYNTGYYNTGNRNTGNGNTGDKNTGNRNTGNGNVGNKNTGNGNTGNRNTGDKNTGNRNTGNKNTGHYNTGHYNTGYYNTGNRNTGNGNTGNGNTGNGNTGNGNVGNKNTGFFCSEEEPLYIFDKISNIKRSDINLMLINSLCIKLSQDDPFDPIPFLSIPNATIDKIKQLHQKHINGRKNMKENL